MEAAKQQLERQIHYVSAGKLLEYWTVYSQMIDVALEHSWRTDDDIELVQEALADGKADLVEILEDGDLVAIAVIHLESHKDGTQWLNVWTVTGENMDTWLGPFIKFLKAVAKHWECEGLTCGGRLGWTRELAKHGWRCKAAIMELEL